MIVNVDHDLCDLQAVCVGLAPAVFDLAEDRLVVLQPEPPESMRDAVESAEAACPMGAIQLVD